MDELTLCILNKPYLFCKMINNSAFLADLKEGVKNTTATYHKKKIK